MSSNQEMEPSDLREFKRKLMRVNGVQAVGESLSNGEFCFKVYFTDEQSMKDAVFPEFESVPIVCVIAGSIEPQ
ncbi:hypothetical protein N9B41_00410 [bacterium]|nr:hypothetical protein [Mariniblastus sp.]MDA7911797.1 hypothetical protein [bacterium]MDA7925735.1 hypothetical protein [Mariniblastus sp.]MDC0294884.1 hypothetical protein [Mariniblastus sp.]